MVCNEDFFQADCLSLLSWNCHSGILNSKYDDGMLGTINAPSSLKMCKFVSESCNQLKTNAYWRKIGLLTYIGLFNQSN